MKEGFESWCLDVIANGVNPDENQQKSFIAWQVCTRSVFLPFDDSLNFDSVHLF